ncbi:hypothetical protein P4V61_15975, partial [Bacillus thuringiensis]|nr:hypothetical protein [Bacillus thuringiensis]
MKKPFYKKWWVWIIAALIIIFVAAGVSGNKKDSTKPAIAENKETKLTVDEYKQRVEKALKEMGEKTKLKINSTEVLEDGRTSIGLSNNIFIFLDTDKDKHIKKA